MLRRVPRNDPLVAACAAQQRDLIEQLAGGITSATTWSDRVARITFLAVALDEMRHNLLDLQAAEPRRAAAAAAAIAGLAADRAATAHLLTDFTAGARAAGWDGTDPVRATADAEEHAHDQLQRRRTELGPDAADTRAAQLANLRQRIDRIRTQIELHPAPEWAGWGLEYRRGLPDQLAAAREELTGLEHPAAPPTAGAANPTAAPREAAGGRRDERPPRDPVITTTGTTTGTHTGMRTRTRTRRRRTPRMCPPSPRCRPPAATRWCRRCRPWEFPPRTRPSFPTSPTTCC